MVVHAFAEFNIGDIPRADLRRIKKDLTIVNPAWAQWSRFGNVYSEEPEKYLCYCYVDAKKGTVKVPRNYPWDNPGIFGNLLDNVEDLTYAKSININFTGKLWDYQREFISRTPDDEDQLHVEPCAHGKTVTGVYWVCRKKLTTLILVPTYLIAQQWWDSFINF